MKIKKLLSVLLASSLAVSSLTAFAANPPAVGTDDIIYYEDFSDNTEHTNYGGKYVVNNGTITDGKYVLAKDNNEGRILYSADKNEISGGIVEVSATFNFTVLGKCARFMASADCNGNKTAYLIKSTDSNTLVIQAYDANGTSTGDLKFSDISVNQDYKITVYMDLDTGRLQLALNDNMVLTNKELYILKDNYVYNGTDEKRADNITRLFDSDNRTGTASYTVDNISAKRIAHLPLTKSTEQVWNEDFTNFTAGSYKDSTDVANNIVEMNTVDSNDTTHGKVFKAVKGTRLLKELSENPNGVYSIKSDMYFTSTTANGIGPKIATSDGGSGAAQLRIQNQKIGITDCESDARIWSSSEYEINKWYTVEMLFNTSDRSVKLYIDGSYVGTATAKALTDYKRIFDINNKDHSIDGTYFDNISVTKIADFKKDSEWENVIVDTDFDGVTVEAIFDQKVDDGITIQNGYMSVPVGARRICNYQSGLTSGTYSLEADVRVTGDTTNQCVLFCSENSEGKIAYNVFADGTNICATGFDKNNNSSQIKLIENYNKNQWYSIRVTMDINTRRVHFYANDIEIVTDKELYIDSKVDTITRICDLPNNKGDLSVAFDMDNFKFYEDKLLEAINVQSGKLSGDITLPTTIGEGDNAKTVRWTTDDANNLTENGVINKNTSQNQYPTLQAMVNDGTTHRATRRYTFYIPSLELKFSNKTGVTSDINDMPYTASDGTMVNWTSSHPNIVTATGAVHRPAETTTVTLTANYGDITKTYTIEVLGMNTEDKVFVTENALYNGSDKLVGKIDVKGKTITYKANVHNATADTISVSGILAAYKNGELVGVSVSDKQDIATKTSGTDIDLNYTVPNEDGYVLKGMIWNMNTLAPYDNAVDTNDKTADLYVLSDSIYANYAENAHND